MTPLGRVVVVGAGFGGLSVARELAKDLAHVQIIDRRNHHLFQPLLYQVATAGLEPSDIAYAVRGITKRLQSVDFTFAEVTGADLDAKVLHTRTRGTVPYDTLVLAAGARTATFGVPGVEEHAFGLKSLDDALDFREHLLGQFESCAVDPGLVARGALNVVVVGGGPTGVEMAGATAELYARVMRHDFPELDVSAAEVTLVEMAPHLLAPFHEKLQANAAEELRLRGVQVRLDTSVAEITAEGVVLEGGDLLPAATCVWAAGVEAVPLGDVLGLKTDRAGRITVNPDLTVPGHPDVFAIGDIASVEGPDGRPLPQLAPVALQQGEYVAKRLADRAAGRQTGSFTYTDKGSMATIGRRSAIAQLPGGIRFTGSLAWLSWLVLHIYFLVGFRNRISVMLNWAWNYLTWDRAARVIVGQVDPLDRLDVPEDGP
ncbi:NAD(P)/FAD-dependent oxidoreductase [Euzebya tangerina]|uniref:NAD(P)/FAD-dependent oxidoreductase n=1 Tax=Euzebya tangerina TaxID=591198 RepID=UPI000E323447|nr:NAD(P)/FAD-dependent oxidoreductase [Euzebya tangerina]